MPGFVEDFACSGRSPSITPVRLGLGEKELEGEASADRHDERDDHGLDVAEAFVLQEEDGEHIERGDDTAPDERDAEEQLQTRWPSRRLPRDRRPRSRFRR